MAFTIWFTPHFSISSICAGFIQTAPNTSSQEQEVFLLFFSPLPCSSLGLSHKAPVLSAEHFLMEPRICPLVIAFLLPFAALHSYINGYYYGMQKYPYSRFLAGLQSR